MISLATPEADQYFQRTYNVIVMLLFFTPLGINDLMFDGVIYGPYYMSLCLALVLILTVGIHLGIGGFGHHFRISYPDVAILALLIYVIVRTTIQKEFQANVLDIVLAVCLTGVYFIFKALFHRNQEVSSRTFSASFIASVIVNVGFGCKQIVESSGNYNLAISGLFSNPSLFAIYLSASMPFSIGIWILNPMAARLSSVVKTAALVAFLGALFVLPFTQSRTGWLAAICGVCLLLFRLYWNAKYRKRLQYLAVSVFMFTFMGLAIFHENILSYKADSSDGRRFIYKQTASIIRDHPLYGVGFNRFRVEYIRYQRKYFENAFNSGKEGFLADNTRVAMSDFLQIWAELGVLSIALIGYIFCNFLQGYGESRLLPGAQGSLASVMIGSCFSYPLHCVPIIIEIVFLCSVISALSRRNTILLATKKTLVNFSVVPLVCFVLLASRIQLDEISARIKWKVATYSGNNGADLEEYRKIYASLRNDPQFLYKYGYELNRVGKYNQSNQVLLKYLRLVGDSDACSLVGDNYFSSGHFGLAEDYYLQAAYITPNKFYPKFKLFELNLQSGRFDQARMWAQAINEMRVKVPSATVYIIKRRVNSWLQEDAR